MKWEEKAKEIFFSSHAVFKNYSIYLGVGGTGHKCGGEEQLSGVDSLLPPFDTGNVSQVVRVAGSASRLPGHLEALFFSYPVEGRVE